MDQLKPAIAWCKKNIFWIGCFLLAVTMIGTWVYSSMDLASRQKKRQSEIEKQLSAIKRVSGTTAEENAPEKAHPNESTESGMDAEIEATVNSIIRGWEKRYNEQKAFLAWPEDILGKETCDFFSRIDVPEKISAETGQGFEKYRKVYYDRIPEFMHRICRNVGVNWKHDPDEIERKRKANEEDAGTAGGKGNVGMGMGGPGAGMGGAEDTALLDELNRFPVLWKSENQDLWYRKLTEFTGLDDHTTSFRYPTFMQANMLQQDLWLLDAMFKNIKEVNAGSSSNDTSIVKSVDHVAFGREATGKLGKLSIVDASLAGLAPEAEGAGGMGSMMMGKMGGGPQGGGPPGGMGSMGGGPPGAADVGERSAYHNRYVNDKLEAISATQVRAVLAGAELPETNLGLIVAKRVPFRLAVSMDERKINEFIAICANSEFIFEVNQIRINRHKDFPTEIEFNGGAATSGSGMGGKMGMGAGFGAGMGGMGGPGDMGGMGGSSGNNTTDQLKASTVESRSDFSVDVEFYGVVKIYNPVRENFLWKAAGRDVVDETAAPEIVAGNAAAQPQAGVEQPAAAQPAAAPAAANPAQPPPENDAAAAKPDAEPGADAAAEAPAEDAGNPVAPPAAGGG